MKRGIIIQARMGASRLPGKVLLPLKGKAVLQHVVDRSRKAKVNEVVVATTTSPRDDEIASYCKKNKIPYFRGPEEDVLARYYLCAKAYGYDEVIRITSDCPLIDPVVINQIIDKYHAEKLDFVRVDTDTYPRGFDCEIFSFPALKQSYEKAKKQDEREHVTMYIRRRPEQYKSSSLVYPEDLSHMRLTLDTPEDYQLLKIVFDNAEKLYMQDVVNFLKDNPAYIDINSKVKQKKTIVMDGSKSKIHIKGDYFLQQTGYGYWSVKPSPSEEFLTDYYKNQYTDELEKINVEDKIETLAQFVSQKSVLDIGCGNGALLRQFKERGWQVSGIEPSKETGQPGDLNIINKSFDEIENIEKTDAVVLNYVLEHHPKPKQFLEKIRDKVLKANGTLLIEVPNDFNILQEVCEQTCGTGKYWIAFPDHLNYFSFESLKKLLENIGFEVIYQESSFPMELFILMGENYIQHKELGKAAHSKRVQFEQNMIKAGKNELKRQMYSKLSELNIGRSIIMYAKKKQ